MIMKHLYSQKGQSLVEILFAIAVFTIGVVTIGYLIFESFASLQHNLQATQARFLASEGLRAASLLRDSLEPGTFGLSLEGGTWTFVPAEDAEGEFTREIHIEEIDLEVYEVTATVAWSSSGDVKRSVVLSTFISNWEQTRGEAAIFSVDINNAALIASSTGLTGIALLNNSQEDATIVGIAVQFDQAQSVEGVTISGTAVFTKATSTAIGSGEYIDIEDYVVGSGTGYYLVDLVTFDSSVEGSDFVLTFFMSDESRRHVVIQM
jgi:Tfp pilus assembly protein PilV